MAKFILSLLILLASLVLQFFAASLGYSFDLAFAALLAAAFLLDWREFLPLVLIGILGLNWQPAASPVILVYGLFPLVVYALHRFYPWEPLAGVILGAVFGVGLLALASGAHLGAIGIGSLLVDAFAVVIWGVLSYYAILVSDGKI